MVSDAAKGPVKPKRRFPIPYGLFIALGVYALAVVGYVWLTYWRSPEYQAAEHYAQALRILGVDDGRKCSQTDLERAFDHVLEAARLMPDVKALAEHAERLRWRFDERHFKLSEESKRRVEAVSGLARRREQEKDPMLVVGLRDRGWGPEQLLEGPERIVLWSLPGGVLIILIWAYGQFNARAVREREHVEDLERGKQELEKLGEYRKGLKSTPAVDDEQTTRDAAPEPPARVKSGSREAVKRVPTGSRAAVERPPSGSRPAVAPARPPSQSRPGVKRKPEE